MKKLPRDVLADLKRSGLTPADAIRLGITYEPEFCPRPGTLGAPTLRAYLLPYFNLSGKLIDHSRVKLLDPYTPAKAKKPAKYLQTPGTSPHFYLPPFFKFKKAARDVRVALWLVEGEKKAAAMCKLGIPAVGLGGVWNFLARADDDGASDPIADFRLFDWKNRDVRIIFDSDAAFNSGIQLAVAKLRALLIRLGANPYEVILPTLKGATKTGADDFIVAKGGGKRAFAALLALPRRSLFVPPGITASDLLATKLTAPRQIVPGLLAQGVTVLGGPPKIGKSWLALDVALAVSANGKALGAYDTAPGAEVLYLALEDTSPRLQGRLRVLKGSGSTVGPRLHLHTEWPRVEHDGLAALDRWLQQHPGCRLVIVDTLARLRADRSDRSDLYFHEYAAIASLKRIADERRIALVLVHHLRKADASDPFDRISGSTGITGAADTNIVLTRGRGSSDGELCITGRDIEEQELALRFDNGRWTVLGPAAEHRTTQAQRAVVDALRKAGKPLSASELGLRLGKGRGSAFKWLLALVESGLVREVEGGRYALLNSVEKGKGETS